MAHKRVPQQQAEQRFDDIIRRALKTPPITNEEIERRSKERRKGHTSR